ncbi:MAG: rubredoxin [Phormidesmis sp.]
MTTEPTSNLDPEQSPPVEETIPLVRPEGETNAAADHAASQDESEAARPLTPAEMDRFECRSCGNTYEPAKGDSRGEIPPGVEFKDLPVDWRCSVCGASQTQFSNVGPAGQASGFKENLNYGFGVNTLTPGQKNVLIFGALGVAVLFFLSLYGLR